MAEGTAWWKPLGRRKHYTAQRECYEEQLGGARATGALSNPARTLVFVLEKWAAVVRGGYSVKRSDFYFKKLTWIHCSKWIGAGYKWNGEASLGLR